MKNNKSISGPDYYENVGFNTIRTWLEKHCLCTLNEGYFHELEPLTNKIEIEQLQEFNDELLASFQRNSPIPLCAIPDITEIFSIIDINGAQLNAENFQDLYCILNCSSHIKRTFKKNEFPLWHGNSRNLIHSKAAISAIEKVFDNAFNIRIDSSAELKQISRAIVVMEGKIKDTMVKLMNRARAKNWLGGEQPVWRNGRSMLPMKVSQKRKIKGIIQDQSATGQTAYVEPLEIIEQNNQLSGLQFKKVEEENRILRELTSYFQPMAEKIMESFHILQYLDRHFTIAKLAHKLKGIRPELNDEGQMLLVKAANPLFTLAGKDVVLLDLELKDNKILLLSGPNAGGKTVVLKSLGLYTIMAQCGMYIPAKKVRLPLFTQFMADIGDRQSIEDDLSTFSAHIQNLSKIIQTADDSTLILLDELGTGTDPDAGAALSRAILETLLKKNVTVIATTHLGSLKVWAFDVEGIINGGMIFDTNALAPTFKLQLGTPGASYALEISKRMGLKNSIVKRSKVLLEDGSVQLENILSELERERLEAESIRLELQKREQKLAERESIIQEKETEIYKIHRIAKSAASLKAERIILETRREAENLIAGIRKTQADKKSIMNTKKQIEDSLHKLQSEKEQEALEITGISKGDATAGTAVFIPRLNMKGNIVHPPDKQDKVRILANGITLSMKLSELQLYLKTKNTERLKNNGPVSRVEPLQSIQIDLRGKRVEEAVDETTKFLDTAVISGVGFVNILHGKGTGVLMEAIHEFLKDQTFVKHFSFAADDQGGAGITVVTLK